MVVPGLSIGCWASVRIGLKASSLLPSSGAASVRWLSGSRLSCDKHDDDRSEPQSKPAVRLKKKDASSAGAAASAAKSAKASFPRIYTRTGDGGKSSLFTGERRSKEDAAFQALGTTDELSSHIGLCIALASESSSAQSSTYVEELQRIQCLLQDIGGLLASPRSSARESHLQRVAGSLSVRHTKELEEWIDFYAAKLPPLENFILPGGSKTSASLHIARAVCRRAERTITPLAAADEVDREVLKYVNRLSDFLFTLARYVAREDKSEETIYRRPQPHDVNAYQTAADGVWKRPKEDA